MRSSHLAAGALQLCLAACATAPITLPQENVQVLFDADRAFAQDTSERRLEGWLSWFVEDAAKLSMVGPEPGPIVRGLAAIREADGPLFADPAVELLWDPDVGGWLSPDIGYTRGRYRLVRIGDGGEELLGEGNYLTLWKKTDQGWRVVMDSGVPDPVVPSP